MGAFNVDFNKISDIIQNFYEACCSMVGKACTSIGDHCIKPLISDKAHTVGKAIHTKIDTIKDFFDRSPTIGKVCEKLGIPHDSFKTYPKELQTFFTSNLRYLWDESATLQADMLKHVLNEFETYKHNKNIPITDKEANDFFNGIKKEIEDLSQDAEKETKLYNELKLNKELFATHNPTRSERALAISKVYGGKVISSGVIKLTIANKQIELVTNNIPQKQLSGFPGDDKGLLQYSSEFQEEKTEHASNLWKQDIYVGDKQVSFIRSGNTRGCEQPAKEILANALALKYTYDEKLNRFVDKNSECDGSKEKPFPLRFSNVQLLTQGKVSGITDGDLPLKQIKIFEELSKKKQPIELNYRGKNVYVDLKPPLLFNFPTNAQGFCKIFKPFVNFKEIDKKNETSYNNLLLIVKEKLEDQTINKTTRDQILNLTEQIMKIYSKNKLGIAENPVALPARIALLTNLLGYATSYGCKSGKDRTGVMSMELENLTAKVLVDNKPYNPYGLKNEDNLKNEEQKNLQSIYKAGNSIKITNTSTGGVQEYLKIMEIPGFTSYGKRYGFDLSKNYNKNLENLNK